MTTDELMKLIKHYVRAKNCTRQTIMEEAYRVAHTDPKWVISVRRVLEVCVHILRTNNVFGLKTLMNKAVEKLHEEGVIEPNA